MMEIIKKTNAHTIIGFALRAVQEVKEGNISAVQTAVFVNALAKSIDIIKKGINDNLLAEVNKMLDERDTDSPTIESYGARITLRNGAEKVKYDGIASWEKAKEELELSKTTLNAIELQIKSATPTAPYIDPISGETILYAPRERGKENISITQL